MTDKKILQILQLAVDEVLIERFEEFIHSTLPRSARYALIKGVNGEYLTEATYDKLLAFQAGFALGRASDSSEE